MRAKGKIKNQMRIYCPHCGSCLKCRVNHRVQAKGWDGIGLCLECGFRTSLAVHYWDAPEGEDIKVELPESGEDKAPQICCPHCRERSGVQTSYRINSAIRYLRIYCPWPTCGRRSTAYLVLGNQLSVVADVHASEVPYAPGLVELAKRLIEESNEETFEL